MYKLFQLSKESENRTFFSKLAEVEVNTEEAQLEELENGNPN